MRAFIDHLPDFSRALPPPPDVPEAQAQLTREPKPARGTAPAPVVPALSAPAPDPAAPIAAAAAQAREQGRAEGEAAARAEAEHQRAIDGEEADRRLADARRDWAAQEGDRLASAIGKGLGQIEDELAARLARAVTPLLAAAVRERALAEMAAAITRAMAGGEAPLMRVCGPPDLIEALRERIEPCSAIAFEASSEAEVTLISASATTFQTQIRSWIERLNAAME